LLAIASDNDFIGEVVILKSRERKLDVLGIVFNHQDTA
jgi:hypothetical protein